MFSCKYVEIEKIQWKGRLCAVENSLVPVDYLYILFYSLRWFFFPSKVSNVPANQESKILIWTTMFLVVLYLSYIERSAVCVSCWHRFYVEMQSTELKQHKFLIWNIMTGFYCYLSFCQKVASLKNKIDAAAIPAAMKADLRAKISQLEVCYTYWNKLFAKKCWGRERGPYSFLFFFLYTTIFNRFETSFILAHGRIKLERQNRGLVRKISRKQLKLQPTLQKWLLLKEKPSV